MVARAVDEVVGEDAPEEPCREASPKSYEGLFDKGHVSS